MVEAKKKLEHFHRIKRINLITYNIENSGCNFVITVLPQNLKHFKLIISIYFRVLEF